MNKPAKPQTHLRGLYAITDASLMPPETFASQALQALKGGASVIQYRDKSNNKTLRQQQASTLRSLCDEYHSLLIINDDIELATYCQADGIHLGQGDQSILAAREALGDKAIIGASCYNSLEMAQNAASAGADYVAFGRFFTSKTKPGAIFADTSLIQQAKQTLKLPIVAIGGITVHNATPIVAAGSNMIAVINGLFGAEDIQHEAQNLCQLFLQT